MSQRALQSVPQAWGLTKRPTLGGFKVTSQVPPQLRVQHCDSEANSWAGAGGIHGTDGHDMSQEGLRRY